MKRRNFIQNMGVLSAGAMLGQTKIFAAADLQFPIVRVPVDKRHFTSQAVENAITKFATKVKDKELAWLFGNCFPNTLDTTVYYSEQSGAPDTYVITGDINAMWMRDSSAQVWPYMQFVKEDPNVHKLIAGVINRQKSYILEDSYANAFYKDETEKSEWETDHTKMRPGIHERKWEIDSLCYPIRLAYHFWKSTGDATPFDATWARAMQTVYSTFIEQQRKENDGPYHFQRVTANATDTQPMSGYGYPVNPVGLISSAFRPSDDATLLSFLIPSNLFAVVSLNQAAEMLQTITKENVLAEKMRALAKEVKAAVTKYGIVEHPRFGKIFAFETDGFGGHILMDDANVPSLLALPYLGAIDRNDPIYLNTRKFVWSSANPFFYKGSAAEGIGGPHVGKDMIWPMSLIIRGLTSAEDTEIKHSIATLKNTHGGTGFMHESFNKDNPAKYTRSWFAWTNTLFGEFLWKVFNEKPYLLS
ncbi:MULTISPECIES: glycoside hydrolase family 125 protein [Chitinophagaceae]